MDLKDRIKSRINSAWELVYFSYYPHFVKAYVTRNPNGGEPDVFVETLRAQSPPKRRKDVLGPMVTKNEDISKVRMSRVTTEINDVAVPLVLDPIWGIERVVIDYRREVVYLFGRKFSDTATIVDTVYTKVGQDSSEDDYITRKFFAA